MTLDIVKNKAFGIRQRNHLRVFALETISLYNCWTTPGTLPHKIQSKLCTQLICQHQRVKKPLCIRWMN